MLYLKWKIPALIPRGYRFTISKFSGRVFILDRFERRNASKGAPHSTRALNTLSTSKTLMEKTQISLFCARNDRNLSLIRFCKPVHTESVRVKQTLVPGMNFDFPIAWRIHYGLHAGRLLHATLENGCNHPTFFDRNCIYLRSSSKNARVTGQAFYTNNRY